MQRRIQEICGPITHKAKHEDCIIYWATATGAAQAGHWVRGYAPAGHAPGQAATSEHCCLTMVSAIIGKGMKQFYFLGSVTFIEMTIDSVKQLSRPEKFIHKPARSVLTARWPFW